ncbi:MAG: hypothetical protein OER95_18750 [Acidimicrobiia bacterium]|nr:hypothetical protein [Acidimicrobiia bacterium]
MRAETVVLVPVKSFDLAKGRLARFLDVDRRRVLARTLAANVIKASGDLPTYVVCDNAEVAAWALSRGTGVLWAAVPGLNQSLTRAVSAAVNDGYRRAVISHADLPLATNLTWLADTGPGGRIEGADVVVVPDRHGTGTNVLSIPIGGRESFRLQYGVGSCRLHQDEAGRLGWSVEVVADEQLGWDLDTPEDLEALELRFGRVTSADAGRTHLPSPDQRQGRP